MREGAMDVTDTTHVYLPTTRAIRAAFEQEIAALGGAVRDAYDDGERLFLRAVLAPEDEVRPGDTVQGGVALRAAGPEVLVHPYTFRQVCTNGAIRAHALETRQVARTATARETVAGPAAYEADVALAALGDAVRACAAPEAFARGVDEMRSATEVDADHALMLLPMLAQLGARMGVQLGPEFEAQFERLFARRVLARFDGGDPRVEPRVDPFDAVGRPRDRSVFALVNAVTSVARDTRDPEARWRLEALGGVMPARLPRRSTRAQTAAVLASA
jgi:hypothetical protein